MMMMMIIIIIIIIIKVTNYPAYCEPEQRPDIEESLQSWNKISKKIREY